MAIGYTEKGIVDYQNNGKQEAKKFVESVLQDYLDQFGDYAYFGMLANLGKPDIHITTKCLQITINYRRDHPTPDEIEINAAKYKDYATRPEVIKAYVERIRVSRVK